MSEVILGINLKELTDDQLRDLEKKVQKAYKELNRRFADKKCGWYLHMLSSSCYQDDLRDIKKEWARRHPAPYWW